MENAVVLGLPKVVDRYHLWRVPLLWKGARERIGEIVIDAYTSLVVPAGTSEPEVIEARLLGREEPGSGPHNNGRQPVAIATSRVRNSVIYGDCEEALLDMPAQSVDLIFTSPPCYNARPEYEDYLSYENYLLKMRRVIHNCRRVLADGRFFVMNNATVLIKPGRAVRFDLGFIGRGNPEITKEKVCRYEREFEIERNCHYSKTCINVDRVAQGSGLARQTERIGARVIQMSVSYWPLELARWLKDELKYDSGILEMRESEIAEFFKQQLSEIPLENFVKEPDPRPAG